MRDALLTVAVGRKKIGKTYTTNQILYQYAKGSVKSPPRKVLIYDVNGEYENIKTLDPNYIPLYSVSKGVDIRRVTAYENNGRQLSTDELQQRLYKILRIYRNGLLIVEDINKYITDNISNDIIGTLATMRHIGVDVIVHFQTKGKAGHPKLYGMMNYIRLHKTSDSFERHKDKFKENLEFLKIGETLVELENKKLPRDKQYFYCYLNTELETIQGQFSNNSFKKAIETYILSNPTQTINPIIKSKDIKGNQRFKDWQTAVEYLQTELYEKYYGN